MVAVLLRARKDETPPRAWGRRDWARTFRVYRRNTPTCMGKTFTLAILKFSSEKHPHVHGEDHPARHHQSMCLETPPRAWGRPNDFFGSVRYIGNTPTCMGKTSRCWGVCGKGQKHPHVHGEDLFCAHRIASNQETPPRAWGRLLPLPTTESGTRNTPTCMGKTPSSRQWHLTSAETPLRAWGRLVYSHASIDG